MIIRFAEKEELSQVNKLRKEVNDLHVQGKPEVFKAGFCEELQNSVYSIWEDAAQKIIIAVSEEEIYGFAIIREVYRKETISKLEQKFLEVEEFCVSKKVRRQGIATKLMDFVKDYAKEKGFKRIDLNVWEFNQSALSFYEQYGFQSYRRYMEIFLDENIF